MLNSFRWQFDNRIHVFAVPPYRALAAGGGGRAAAHRAELAKR